ncbi:NAD(P)/FAD-dependent oxidoreductase [Amycolatopsis sp. NPDC059657]|uniref:NAD(P)/FAD-dependent oxidoreductase n=1 Tax=Amycolatopsis sp. NPDC059657 TaxID=3346899 RepID=UPI00366D79CA
MTKILVVGGGYAGFYTAWKLEKRLRRREAELIVVEARHAAVSLRRHLRRTRVVAGMVTTIDHAARRVTVRPAGGPEFELGYDIIVVTAGAVTRKFPVPGIAERAIGLKHVEEAVAIRDRPLTAFDRASALPTFFGGGFSGVEGFGELLALATALRRLYPDLEPAFHLVEARDRILPEVTERPGRWVVRSLERGGATVHRPTPSTRSAKASCWRATSRPRCTARRRNRTRTTASARSRRWDSGAGSSSTASS